MLKSRHIIVNNTKQVWRLQDGTYQQAFIRARISRRQQDASCIRVKKHLTGKRLDDPDAIIHMNKVLSMAKTDGHLYYVVLIDRK